LIDILFFDNSISISSISGSAKTPGDRRKRNLIKSKGYQNREKIMRDVQNHNSLILLEENEFWFNL